MYVSNRVVFSLYDCILNHIHPVRPLVTVISKIHRNILSLHQYSSLRSCWGQAAMIYISSANSKFISHLGFFNLNGYITL
jgi:hypothetical protein